MHSLPVTGASTQPVASDRQGLRPLAALGQAAARPLVTRPPVAGFAERLDALGTAAEPLPVLPQAQAGTTGEPRQVPTRADEAAEGDAPLTAEQWLLGMLGQQQVQVQVQGQARSQQDVEPGEPLPAAAAALALRMAPPAAPRQEPGDLAVVPGATAAQGTRLDGLPSTSGGEATPAAPASLAPEAVAALAEALEDGAGEPSGEPGPTALPAAERGAASPAGGAERSLRLQAPEARWGEQMLQTLRENVELQLAQRSQSATIRLDPPELGSLEILLSHESGRLHVQLSAANADVARLLQQTSERLRQELVGQQFVQVQVQVGAEGGSGHGQSRRQAPWLADEPVAANSAAPAETAGTSGTRPRDVLVTV
ncbi:flagellar hook-length control protein FliK [Pseudomonas oligotrophica]|uniref:flagellar hook-length control protein FliK n=1 Tax=Pseudomonas oligotrophica TaxID=2912055 RepID=UPI001F419203|nr:flagellar hook-length control protein FliK [Pseudomonas oligotrophica]MCF7200612.1 flagellar hook-length control protein FliK [Pseudomonas oligotrophica]